jgi:DNA-binding transcriptional LysR family regulator
MQKSTSSNAGFDWGDVQFFLVAARAGSAAKAARRLAVDQATVSRRIRALEEALRAPLFQRGPRGHVLTAAGERLLRRAEEMETASLAAHRDLTEASSAVTGTLRVAGPEGFLCAFLAPRLGRLGEAHPGLDVQLTPMPHLMSVSKREADIAITVGQVLEGRVIMRRIADYSLGLFASRDYLARKEPVIRRSDLSQHRIIGYIDDLIVMPELDYLGEILPGLRASFQSSSLIAQMALTVAGAGLCVLPHYMAAAEPRLVPVLAEEVRLARSYWLIVHKDMKETAPNRAFIDFVVAEARRCRDILLPGAGQG